jgi:hypothetical protein
MRKFVDLAASRAERREGEERGEYVLDWKGFKEVGRYWRERNERR